MLPRSAQQDSSPRAPLMPWLQPGGTLAATSFYDTKSLRDTLERLVDFDRINAGMTRFSAGAVNVRTGNFVYFDSSHSHDQAGACHGERGAPTGLSRRRDRGRAVLGWRPRVQHATAVGDREQPPPPGYARISRSISGARGAQRPRNMAEVATRQKEIQFSSRTRASTDQFKNVHRVQRALAALLRRLPGDLEENDDLEILKSVASDKVYNIIHLIYRAQNYEGHSKDYEFSRLSMQDHWRAGYHDAAAHAAPSRGP